MATKGKRSSCFLHLESSDIIVTKKMTTVTEPMYIRGITVEFNVSDTGQNIFYTNQVYSDDNPKINKFVEIADHRIKTILLKFGTVEKFYMEAKTEPRSMYQDFSAEILKDDKYQDDPIIRISMPCVPTFVNDLIQDIESLKGKDSAVNLEVFLMTNELCTYGDDNYMIFNGEEIFVDYFVIETEHRQFRIG